MNKVSCCKAIPLVNHEQMNKYLLCTIIDYNMSNCLMKRNYQKYYYAKKLDNKLEIEKLVINAKLIPSSLVPDISCDYFLKICNIIPIKTKHVIIHSYDYKADRFLVSYLDICYKELV